MRGKAAVAAAVTMLGLLVAPAQAQAAAYPTSTFAATGDGGKTAGGFIWYNRSVGVQGSVTDFADGWEGTTVHFDFYVTGAAGERVWHDADSRSVTSADRSFNFTQDPMAATTPKAQAITSVLVQVCSSVEAICGAAKYFDR
ncbi:hypothetical protein [Symbioplanes lichenis]|uniref:hypothetical protein n=1 Tax=Symbioplanes lichenis TaxID=1629072 RepID=UPI002739C975|nr:hypothetical protein [Actinoplanes lichenis]